MKKFFNLMMLFALTLSIVSCSFNQQNDDPPTMEDSSITQTVLNDSMEYIVIFDVMNNEECIGQVCISGLTQMGYELYDTNQRIIVSDTISLVVSRREANLDTTKTVMLKEVPIYSIQ